MRYALCVSLLAIAGCSTFGLGGSLEIESDPPALVFENTTSRTVYYVAIESEAAARVDLVPDVTRWPSLAAGETRRLPYADLDGYDEGDTEAVVFWSTGGGYVQERVRL